MSKTALKKSILFGLALVLLLVYFLQLSLTGRAKDKTISLSKDVDRVTIEKRDGNICLEKIDGEWKISTMENQEQKFTTEEYPVQNIVDAVSKIHLLGTVSSGNANRVQRYGLDDDSKIAVSVYGKNKLLRTVFVGKNSGSGSQCYVQIDGKKSVMVADGALQSVFDKTISSLRNKTLYEIASDSISSIRIKNGESEFELLLDQVETIDSDVFKVANQRTEWKLAKSPEDMVDVVLDQGNVGTWIASLSSMKVYQWCEPYVNVPERAPDIEVEIAVGGMIYSINMYSEDDDKYLCSSNQTDGLFYILKSSASSYAKDLNDLIVKFEPPAEALEIEE